jgi:hypothetical protein
MTRSNDQTALEQTLTEHLAQLPVPIRIVHHKPEHGAWYQWKTMLTGSGDCGTFADAVIQAITYQQEHEMQQALIATPARYTLDAVATLGECLRRTRKVRPTSILYLYLGAQGWLESGDAYDLVVKSRSMELSWDAYLEDGQGPDPAGICLFGSDGGAYRGFDVELEETYPPQRGTIHILREED